MRQQKLSRSSRIRFAMIPIVLLCLTASGCANEQPAAPRASAPVARNANIPYNRFFTAWSRNYTSGAIQTQTFGLDVRQDRQFVDWFVNEQTLAFARANPGRLTSTAMSPTSIALHGQHTTMRASTTISSRRFAVPIRRRVFHQRALPSQIRTVARGTRTYPVPRHTGLPTPISSTTLTYNATALPRRLTNGNSTISESYSPLET
jgi:hypothetical protein